MIPLSNAAHERLQLELHYRTLLDRRDHLMTLQEDKKAELLRSRSRQIFAREKTLSVSEKEVLFEAFCQHQEKQSHPVLIRNESPAPWESFDFLTRILWDSFVRESLEKQLFPTSLEDDLALFLKTEDVEGKLQKTLNEMSDLVLRLEKLPAPSGQLRLFDWA
ncbi:hypothetical protein Bealeia2_01898 (plasmid) [Candidatus Bealeia paramacronuclearis]|uniref:hypothetical protein n=1 Tax=Candidatus Bealeia paramacronuclearis TaxID=1921001 RepID=UPI002C437EF2|nr:hypothetical protein [Candidatus Bealeia paramacronuclearis]